jgi:hypothetical protein
LAQGDRNKAREHQATAKAMSSEGAGIGGIVKTINSFSGSKTIRGSRKSSSAGRAISSCGASS